MGPRNSQFRRAGDFDLCAERQFPIALFDASVFQTRGVKRHRRPSWLPFLLLVDSARLVDQFGFG